MSLHGIDVSSSQTGIDLAAVPCDFVIVKATEGVGYVSPVGDTQVQQARSLGKLWGFYHFVRNNDAIAEADFFVDNCLNYFGEGIPVLDYEGDAVKSGPGWVGQWVERIHERTSVWPLFYSYQSHIAATNYTNISNKCGLWVARYESSEESTYDYPDLITFPLGSWDVATIWQYSSTGRLPGYSGHLDLNFAYLTRDAWGRIARGDR